VYSIELVDRISHDIISRYRHEAELWRLRPQIRNRIVRFIRIIAGTIDSETVPKPGQPARSRPSC
jgi:hypothetical protein